MYLELSKHILPFSTIDAAIRSNTLYEQHIKGNQDLEFIAPTKLQQDNPQTSA